MAADKCAWIIDDEAVNRALASAFLQRMGWTTREMASGFEALEAASAGLPELLVVDIRMPGMSGTELMGQLRRRCEVGSSCFLAYTAHSLDEEIDDLREAGFHRILLKPVSYQQMKDAVDACRPAHH
jgi:CheY-like chemotaxis protein